MSQPAEKVKSSLATDFQEFLVPNAGILCIPLLYHTEGGTLSGTIEDHIDTLRAAKSVRVDVAKRKLYVTERKRSPTGLTKLASDMGLRPALIVQTGPHDFDAYWNIADDVAPSLGECQYLLHKAFPNLQDEKDESDAFPRVPGFLNRDLDEPFQVKVVHQDDTAPTYTLAEIRKRAKVPDNTGVETDKIFQLPPLTAIPDEEPRRLQPLCQRWVWVIGIERFINRKKPGQLWRPTQFDSQYNPIAKKGSISKQLFASTFPLRRFKRMTFAPGKDEYTADTYNTWRPSLVIPKEGDTSLWDAHVAFLVPDPTDRDHLLNWLAWVYQHQALKPNHALLIVGETFGTGKSYIARVMEFLLGLDNTQRPKNSSLNGDFNAWVASCKLSIIEELMQIGRKEVEGTLRDLITEPRVEVNIKMISPFLVDSYMAMMAVSNHPDALPLKPGDRRWLVIESPVTEEQKQAKIADGYYAKLMPMVEKDHPNLDALAAIAYQLKHRPLNGYDARGEAPMTDAKVTMIDLGRTPLQSWLNDERENDPFTRRVVNIRDDIVPHIPPHIMREQSSRAAEMTIAKFLKRELQGVNIGDHRVGGNLKKLWVLGTSRHKLSGDGERVTAIDGELVPAAYAVECAAGKTTAKAGGAPDDFNE